MTAATSAKSGSVSKLLDAILQPPTCLQQNTYFNAVLTSNKWSEHFELTGINDGKRLQSKMNWPDGKVLQRVKDKRTFTVIQVLYLNGYYRNTHFIQLNFIC